MKVFALLHLASGFSMPLCILRLLDGNFEDWPIVVGWTAGLNALTLLCSYVLFRPMRPRPILDAQGNQIDEEQLPDRLEYQFAAGLSYLIGIGIGFYFYYT